MDATNLVLIGSMPRSGSAWLANALSLHPDALFLHEGIVKCVNPIQWLELSEYSIVGDIGTHCMFPNLDRVKAKRVYLSRNKNEVILSAQKFLDLDEGTVEDAVDEIEALADKWCHRFEPYLINYTELFTKEGLTKLWDFIFNEPPEWDKLSQAISLNIQAQKPSQELKTLLLMS